MITSRSTWLVYSILVCGDYLAVIFIAGVLIAFRGHHSENLHALISICALVVVFGSPPMTVIGWLGLRNSHRLGIAAPRYSKPSVLAAGLLAVLIPLVWAAFIAAGVIRR